MVSPKILQHLKAELSGFGMVWFDPQAMTNMLSFGNIAKQYPVHYLQESDTFQVQLCHCINIFGHKTIHPGRTSTSKRVSKNYIIPRECFPHISDITCPNY